MLNLWVNLYRTDDYVGTTFEGYRPTLNDSMKPINRELDEPNGHVDYWRVNDIVAKL